MKGFVFFLLAFAFATQINAQTDTIFSEENLASKSLMIKDDQNSGTCFLIQKEEHLFLVTADHIANVIDFNSAKIIFSINNRPFEEPLADFSKTIKWIRSDSADIAVMELMPWTTADKESLKVYAIPFDVLLPILVPLPRSIDVLSFGYPISSIGEYFSPNSFHSKVANGAISLPRADNNKISNFYVLENPSIQGFSGGPVFVGAIQETGGFFHGNMTILVGITHGNFGDKTGGKNSLVTPSYYIYSLINRIK